MLSRSKFIAAVATELEYDLVFCFCSTSDGYEGRVKSVVEGLSLMGDERAWMSGTGEEDYEDAQEAIEIMKRLCR